MVLEFDNLRKSSQILRLVWLLVPVLTILGKSIDTPSTSHRGPIDSKSEITKIRHGLRLQRRVSSLDQHNQFVFGLSFQHDSPKKIVNYDESGKVIIMESTEVILRVYGHFVKTTTLATEEDDENIYYISFTKVSSLQAGACNSHHSTPEVKLTVRDEHMAYAKFLLPTKAELPDHGYLCVRKGTDPQSILQGPHEWLTIELDSKILPTWLQILFVICLLMLSGLFSGLNLGLMSLNKTDLKIIINTGTVKEKNHAAKIAPVRNHGNFLLCCLLFSNVLVNTTLTILMDDLTSGEIAIILSTLAIVVFGEIIPQAICSRHGLAVGAKTIYITKFFMLITFPMAYPLSKILDRVLGEEIGSVYTRERLKELLRVTKDHHGLENEEVGIISGALDMKTKTVKDVMTKFDSVFMLSIDAILNYDTMSEIEYHGYSRIPIYEGERNNIVALLNVKQLTLLDPSDNIPLKTVIEYHQSQLFYVFDHDRLDYLFRTFRDGLQGHMAFVQRVQTDGPGDPYYETIGIVTMEDVLEELLQAEIMDESDVGKFEARTAHSERPKNIPFMLNKKAKPSVEIPQSLAIAAVQFLSSSVEPFRKEFISVNILERLIRTTVVFAKAPKMKYHEDSKAVHTYIYEQGKPSQYFVMILEGRVEVCVGRENMTYESGPFTVFGADFLMANRKIEQADNNDNNSGVSKRLTYLPDYTVKVLQDVTYFRLKVTAYKAALVASELEKTYTIKAAGMGDWEDEIEKVLNEVDEVES